MNTKTSKSIAIEHTPILINEYTAYSPLDFTHVEKKAAALADLIESQKRNLINILLDYESFEVATDEIERTLDLLRNLKDNEQYFKLRIGAVTTFLPRNQPLYALSCFVIIPSLLAHEVHFRIPHSMKNFLPKVLALLQITALFPNIVISPKERTEFLKERSALLVNPDTKENRPVTDAVIFTGTSIHADQLRLVFDRRTLFISNGSGHNPIVISKSAHIKDAVEAVLTLTLYNQGQDCAAPNSILIHQEIFPKFIARFYKQFKKVKIGPYHNRKCRVGPISNPDDLAHIANIIVENRHWLDAKTPGVIRTAEAIVEPTIICKPLIDGGNYEESFAPIIFLQQYTKDEALATYFETQRYAHNAMYITLYGKSEYIKHLIGKTIKGRIVHHKDTFLHNTHLHIPGVERGIQPYGGYGPGASSVSINGKVTAMPTLPQRDIFEYVAKPLLEKGVPSPEKLSGFTHIEHKHVEKILKLSRHGSEKEEQGQTSNTIYLDLSSVKTKDARYVKIEESSIYPLVNEPNTEFIATLSQEDIKLIKNLRTLLHQKSKLSAEEFLTQLYALAKDTGLSDEENKARQLRFFQNVYQLLFKKESGPRLTSFLWEVDIQVVDTLLDV